jgi:hypothetical protein
MKKRMITYSVLSGFLALALFTGCSPKLEKYPRETCAALPGDSLVSIIKDKCGFCHSKDFKNKDDICAYKKMIIESVGSGSMPKIGSLAEDQKKAILDWK